MLEGALRVPMPAAALSLLHDIVSMRQSRSHRSSASVTACIGIPRTHDTWWRLSRQSFFTS